MIHTSIHTAQDATALLARVTAAPGHHVRLRGASGTGKTMLALRIAAALPAPEGQEALDIAWISQACLPGRRTDRRPFRAPHHTCSTAAIFGGGRSWRPGELTLAHGGVLLLDEATELPRTTLQQLAFTLDYGTVDGRFGAMPARPWCVVLSERLCACDSSAQRLCTCGSSSRVARHQARTSVLDSSILETATLAWSIRESQRFAAAHPSWAYSASA